MRQLAHWLRRTRSTRSDRAPTASGLALANDVLGPAEMALFGQMSRAEQTHATDVACYVAAHLDELGASSTSATDGGRAVIVAALMHDAGKIGAADGTAARTLAALCRPLIDNRWANGRLGRWLDCASAQRTGRLACLAALLCYTHRGARLLRAIDSSDIAIRWAAEHHRGSRAWTVPRDVGRLLAAADRQ